MKIRIGHLIGSIGFIAVASLFFSVIYSSIIIKNQAEQNKPSTINGSEKASGTVGNGLSPLAHQGTILVKNISDKTQHIFDIHGAPIEAQFVFFKNGREVSYNDQYDEAVPIVEIELTSRDKNGKIVQFPKVAAQTIETKEYGPERRLLKTTIVDTTSPKSNAAITPPVK